MHGIGKNKVKFLCVLILFSCCMCQSPTFAQEECSTYQPLLELGFSKFDIMTYIDAKYTYSFELFVCGKPASIEFITMQESIGPAMLTDYVLVWFESEGDVFIRKNESREKGRFRIIPPIDFSFAESDVKNPLVYLWDGGVSDLTYGVLNLVTDDGSLAYLVTEDEYASVP